MTSTVITGASGVVGGAVARHVIQSGRTLRGLARSESARDRLADLGVEPVPGDILDYRSLIEAFAGTDVVYHVAGVNQFCMKDPTAMYRANVDGTRNVIRAAQARGVRRIVYTSSAIVLGEEKGTVGSETSPHRGRHLSHYERSKFEAERVAFAEARDVELVVVNPSSVQGPGRATGTGGLILDVVNGKLPLMVDSTLSVIDIDDCARGHTLAEERGEPGRRYVLNGFSVSVREAVAMLGQMTGRRLSLRYVPRSAVRMMGPVLDLINRVRPIPFCGEMIRAMLQGHTYDGSRATRELGLEYTGAEDTLRRTMEWFRSEGLTNW